MLDFWGEKRKRKPVSEAEWKTTKAILKNKCVICGRTEKNVGKLTKAHIKAHSKGGTQVFPMCRNCHGKYDDGLLPATQLKKIGLTKADYERLRPKKKKKEKRGIFGF